MSTEQDEIDPRNNPESQVADGSATQLGSRSSLGGAVPSPARPADAVPGRPDPDEPDPDSGTSGGNPLAGLLIDPADAEQAVPGDEGPEHPGRR